MIHTEIFKLDTLYTKMSSRPDICSDFTDAHTTSFLTNISPEHKDLLELTYSLFTDGYSGSWCCIIVDNKGSKQCLQGSVAEDMDKNNRMELFAIIKGFEAIESKLTVKSKNYATVQVFCESTYCTNVLKDWIFKWSEENFENRPNKDLLIKAWSYVQKFQKRLEVQWTSHEGHEILEECFTLIRS